MTSPATKQPVYFNGIGKFKGFSAFTLKVIAMFVMLCDHTSVAINGGDVDFWRIIGRIGFPIFAFFIAEGAGRTKNIYKYMLRLGIFALISEIPFDLVANGCVFDMSGQNVYFTLLLGLASIWVYTLLAKRKLGILSVFTTAGFSAIAYLLHTDYEVMGVIVVFLFYFAVRREMPYRPISIFAVCAVLILIFWEGMLYINTSEVWALFAVIPIMFYNGEKGAELNRYFFYGFYPGHLLLVALAAFIIERM